jgi:hypothetical protein
MDNETKPGKVVYKQRWKASSLVTHDFLLAAMLICLTWDKVSDCRLRSRIISLESG